MTVAQTLVSDPEALGLIDEQVEALLARARREVDEGLLRAAQVALARNGKLAFVKTFGEATDDSLFCLFSATKAVTSAAAWLLIQEGALALDEKVADIIEPFGWKCSHWSWCYR